MTATFPSNIMKPNLSTQHKILHWSEVGKTKKLMQIKVKVVYLNAPPGTTEGVIKRTVIYRIMNNTTKTIEIALFSEL